MTDPNIFPVEPGRDEWKPIFDSAAARALHHCGLIPLGTRGRKDGTTAILWAAPDAMNRVPEWIMTPETRPLKITLVALKNVLKRVGAAYGSAELRDILRVHGNCANLMALRPVKYRHVYVAAMAALDRAPTLALPPPPNRKPYA